MIFDPGVTGRKPWQGVPARAPMHRVADLCKLTGLSKSTIYQQQADGLFPPMIKLGLHASAVPDSWLSAYFDAQAAKVAA